MHLNKILTPFYILTIALLIGISPVLANSTGSYTSAAIGEVSASRFTTFSVIEQVEPAGTCITYSFAGSNDNYSSWSNAQATDSTIDLSTLTNLTNSKYIKVKINMSSSNDSFPSLKGFEVTYETISASTSTESSSSGSNGSSDSSSGASSGTSSNESSSSSNSSNSSSSDSKSSNAEVKTQTVTLSQNQKKNQLVSTGSNLWANIGIALVLTGVVTFLLFRKKYNENIDKV